MATSGLLDELSAEVDAVRVAWRPFAVHAEACTSGCSEVAKYCRRPGRQSSQLDPRWDDCCEEGKELFATWRLAIGVLRDRYRREPFALGAPQTPLSLPGRQA